MSKSCCGSTQNSHSITFFAQQEERFVVAIERDRSAVIHVLSRCQAAPYLWANPSVFVRLPPYSHGTLCMAGRQPNSGPAGPPFIVFDFELHHASDTFEFQPDCAKDMDRARKIIESKTMGFLADEDEPDSWYYIECPPESMAYVAHFCDTNQHAVCEETMPGSGEYHVVCNPDVER